MKHIINISEASIYVGTYQKYNNGSLNGGWLNLSDYTDLGEFYDACRDLHKDEENPEFMFQDYENIPDSLISECSVDHKLFEFLEAFESLDKKQKEPFLIWCDNGHYNLSQEDMHELLTHFENEYIGEYESEEAFAYELVEIREDISDFAKQYFDYETFARDLFTSDYWSSGRYIFYNN